MPEFNKEKALDELMEIFKTNEKSPFSEKMKAMQSAQDYLEIIHLIGFQKGLEAGLKKLDINTN